MRKLWLTKIYYIFGCCITKEKKKFPKNWFSFEWKVVSAIALFWISRLCHWLFFYQPTRGLNKTNIIKGWRTDVERMRAWNDVVRVAWQRVKEQLEKFQSFVLASFFTYYWKAIFVCTRFSALSPSCVIHFKFFLCLLFFLFLSRWYCLSYFCWFSAFNEKLRSKGLSFCMILQVLMYLKAEEKVFVV